MKILVIGSGGREHALVWKLAQSPHASGIWCVLGNAGIARETLGNGNAVECVPVHAEDLPALLTFARENKPELTVVGPDNPLALGVVDLFQKEGFRIWGPNQKAARFEASKAFSQAFMERHGIPTARAGTFSDPADARRFAASLDGRCAVKADGLALGKGVLVCTRMEEAGRAIDEMLVAKRFGEAGSRVVIQELLEGREISLHALCDGSVARLFPASQDHKRAFDGDEGPNTGGMGAYAPAPFLSTSELAGVEKQILDPWLAGCAAEGIDFRGVLYPGMMLTAAGPKVIEFNARFGDPEAQVYLACLENDLVELLEASLTGTLSRMKLEWRPVTAVCIVMASAGYPGGYEKGKPIEGLDAADRLSDVKIFHAGTRLDREGVVTNGGRVLGVTAWGETLPEARERAYAGVETLHFEGAHYRRDIGARGLRPATSEIAL